MATWTRGALGTVFVVSALWLLTELTPGKPQQRQPRARAWWL
jgi:hypothetical protein